MAVAEESSQAQKFGVLLYGTLCLWLLVLRCMQVLATLPIRCSFQVQAMSRFVQVLLFLYSSELFLDPGSASLPVESAIS